jgi:hypothetical protein
MNITIRDAREDEYEYIAEMALNTYRNMQGFNFNDQYIATTRDVAGRAKHHTVLVAVNENDEGTSPVLLVILVAMSRKDFKNYCI